MAFSTKKFSDFSNKNKDTLILSSFFVGYQDTGIRSEIQVPIIDLLNNVYNQTQTIVNINSGQWGSASTSYIANSGNFNSTYVTVRNLSAGWGGLNTLKWDSTYTTVYSNSAFWQNSFSILNANSGNWQNAYTTLKATSATWDNTSLIVNNYFQNWNDTTSTTQVNSGNWQDTYSTVYANSAQWNVSIDTGVRDLTGNWENTYSTVYANSAQWATDSTSDTAVRDLTGNWENTYSTVYANSAQWNVSIDTGVRAVTGNWQNTYSTVYANSAQWASNVDTGVRAITGNWQNTYTVVWSNSASWDAAAGSAGADIAVRSLTGNWENTYNNVYTNSASWIDVFTTTQNNSANWDYNGTDVKLLTGNWEDTYTTVRTNSAQWASNTDIGVRALTGNWQNTYTTVNNLSGRWSSVYSSVNASSANWGYLGTDIKALTGNWQSTFTNVNENSGSWQSTFTNVNENSGNWQGTYTLFSQQSGDNLAVQSVAAANSAAWIDTNTTVWSYSATWGIPFDPTRYDDTYTTVITNSANWELAYQNQSNYFEIAGGTITGDTLFQQNVTIYGDLSCSGTQTFANTIFSTTSALSVVHVGSGPAMWVGNNGTGDIASFYDLDENVEVLHVGGNNGSFPNVGVKTSEPNKTLTVNGEISANSVIWDPVGNSNDWNSVYSNVQSNSATTWNYQGTDLKFLSSGWVGGNAAYTTLNAASANYILDGGNAKGSNLIIGTNDSLDLILETNSTPRITVLGSGNVGIGISNPTESLTVVGNISATGVISASASNIKINVINDATNRTFTDADNNKIVHIDTTTTSLCAIFPNTLSSGFNVTIMNVGTNTLVLSANNLKSAGTSITTQYGGVYVYKDSNDFFAVGKLI
jgi:hypothetical protein